MKALFFLFLSISLIAWDISYTQEEREFLEKKGSITMCVDPDWYPFEEIKEGAHRGIAADLITLLAQRAGLSITLIPTQTWQESLRLSEQKKCDILSFLNQTPQREEWLVFSDVLLNDPNVIIARNEYPMIHDLSKELASIALPEGSSMQEFFAKKYPNLIIVPTQSEEEGFKLVENKNVDLTLRSLIISAYTIKKEGLFNLKIVHKPLGYENFLRIGINKDLVILQSILNKAIATLSQEDRDRIINDHINIVVNKIEYITLGVWIFVGLLAVLLLIFIHNQILSKRVAKELEKNSMQQKLLHQKNKKEELGELIANISHQWRDGLSRIAYLNLHTLMKIKLKKELSPEYLLQTSQEIEASIDFMSRTMQDFLDFYKPSTHLSRFDVQESITAAVHILDTKMKLTNATLEIKAHEILEVEGIKSEWIHIWLNLINNSLNAAQKAKIPTPKVEILIQKNQITYLDNCGAIDTQTLKQIQENAHYGLGLTICKEIAHKSGWGLEIENTNSGTRFLLKRSTP